jgi:ABC-type transporter Mla MlaB component
MVTKATSWQLEDTTLYLRGAWLRDQVANALPKLPTSGIACVDMSAVTQVDSAVMTVLLAVRGEAKTLGLHGVSDDLSSLLDLYHLTPFFTQEAV